MVDKKLKVVSETREGVVILHVVGSVDHVQYYQLEEAIQTQLDKKRLHLVVDLTELTYICSAGINTLGHGAAQYEKVGSICFVQPQIKAQWQFFIKIGIDRLIPWAESLEAALKRVGPPAA